MRGENFDRCPQSEQEVNQFVCDQYVQLEFVLVVLDVQ